MNLYDSYLDIESDELVTTGFTWVDAQGMLHIHLPTLKERLAEIGLTVEPLPAQKEGVV